MKTLQIIISKNKNTIAHCHYLYLGDDCFNDFFIAGKYYDEVWNLSLFEIKIKDEYILEEGVNYDISINIITPENSIKNFNKIGITPLHSVYLENSKSITMNCKIDFIDEEDNPCYSDYNQPMIDLFYHWENNDSAYTHNMKCTSLYTKATLNYAGVPQKIALNSIITLDGEAIFSTYHFYNTLSELLLGEKRYIASNLDALEDSLQCCSIEKDVNKNVITIINSDKLERTLQSNLDNYLAIFIEIMENFGFKMILKK